MIKIERKIKNSGTRPLSVHTREKIADVPQFCTKQAGDSNFLCIEYYFFKKTTTDLINNTMQIIHKKMGEWKIWQVETWEKSIWDMDLVWR